MRFRTKNDINYIRFLEVSSKIEDDTDENQILEEAYKIFKPKDINRFAAALEKNGRLKMRFKLDLNFREAGRFIDADTYRKDGEQLNMLKSLLVPKRKRWSPWKRYKIEDISLQEAEAVLKEWGEFLELKKLEYEYIYNPPIRINPESNSQGSAEREAFSQHYGGYAEITYLLGAGKYIDFPDVWKMDLDLFLFWGEYALRKRDVENIK